MVHVELVIDEKTEIISPPLRDTIENRLSVRIREKGWVFNLEDSNELDHVIKELISAKRDMETLIRMSGKQYMRVDSSNIEALRYDLDNNDLFVDFKSGAYVYREVPVHIVLNFVNSDSLGGYLHKHIKGNYEYEKLNHDEKLNHEQLPG